MLYSNSTGSSYQLSSVSEAVRIKILLKSILYLPIAWKSLFVQAQKYDQFQPDEFNEV